MLRVPVVPVLVALAACLAWCGLPAPASAQSVSLTLTPATVTFADADPDTTNPIVSPNLAAAVSVSGGFVGYDWRLTLQATNLTTGSATIPITNVTWTATPSPFVASGTVSTSVQTVASGHINCFIFCGSYSGTGTFVFRLANSWTYNAGVYTSTFTFILSAP